MLASTAKTFGKTILETSMTFFATERASFPASTAEKPTVQLDCKLVHIADQK